mmetsp:Transcript_69758/g.102211  ORF Transcript_69758/g.102211 Transcript_69758/m.102211 type:complete len:94 (+) Transcript_69758:202-483(+)
MRNCDTSHRSTSVVYKCRQLGTYKHPYTLSHTQVLPHAPTYTRTHTPPAHTSECVIAHPSECVIGHSIQGVIPPASESEGGYVTPSTSDSKGV